MCPLIIFKDTKIINVIKNLYEKYNNSKHLSNFIKSLGSNINKLTLHNMDNLFNMYILVCTKKFNGFERWGPGNNKNSELNLINHYKKHVLNGNENWDKYLRQNKLSNVTPGSCGPVKAEIYGNFAINISKYMKKRIIHTNGTNVYLSGLYEKILIIGRLDSNYNLGISSCYIISDDNYAKKINNFEKNTCFKNI